MRFTDKDVALTNAAPDAITLSAMSVAENTLVNTIVASSCRRRRRRTLHYSLVSNPDGAFRLDNGNLLLARRSISRRKAHELSITVKAEDDYGGSTTRTFTLDLTNVVEVDGAHLHRHRNADGSPVKAATTC